MDKIICDICHEVYEFEDDGTTECMPDGYLTEGRWICDKCGSCLKCGKTLEKEKEKRGKNIVCRDCEGHEGEDL